MRLVFDVSRMICVIVQMIQVIQVSMGRFNPSWTDKTSSCHSIHGQGSRIPDFCRTHVAGLNESQWNLSSGHSSVYWENRINIA